MIVPTAAELVQSLRECVMFNGEDETYVKDFKKFREKHLDSLAYFSVFHSSDETRDFIRWLIKKLALSAGIIPASIQSFYKAKGSGKYSKVTVPAVNLRGLTYDMSRAMFAAGIKMNTGAMIFEIARSEIRYTDQRPAEYTAVILAAALREGVVGPVFFQADHFQFGAEAFKNDPVAEIKALEDLTREAIAAGFYNIDIDASTLVDLRHATIEEQQRVNAEQTAYMTKFVRSCEPKGITVSVGGEIGEVGGKNSTVDELRVFLDSYLQYLRSDGNDEMPGLSKVSVQTGTVHGGIPNRAGIPEEPPIDFTRLEELSKLAISAYKVAGVVQHGASTLPMTMLDRFPQIGVAEIHLATQFQNAVFDHPQFPADLYGVIADYLRSEFGRKKNDAETDKQFFYRTRKYAWGKFKRQIWSLDEKVRLAIRGDLQKRFEEIFKRLGVKTTSNSMTEHVEAVKVISPLPEPLRKLVIQ